MFVVQVCETFMNLQSETYDRLWFLIGIIMREKIWLVRTKIEVSEWAYKTKTSLLRMY